MTAAREGTVARARRPSLPSVAWAGIVAVLSLLAAVQAMELWRWRPGDPLWLEGDWTQVAMEVRDTLDHGWYWHNEDLGFPFAQVGPLFPDINVMSTLFVKAVGLFTHDVFTVIAVVYVLGFPLAGLTFAWLARRLGIGRVASVVVGVLAAVLPGHQTMHPYLAGYWVVPFGLWLLIRTARGDRLLAGADGLGLRAALTSPRAATLLQLTALGLSHVYWPGFTLILLSIVLVIRVVATRRLVTVIEPVLAAAWLGLVAVSPLIVGRLATRDVVAVGQLPATRSFTQSETYAGKLMDLVLPWHGHRVPGLAYVTWAYGVNDHPTVEQPALGIVALAGVVVLSAVTLLALLERTRTVDRDLFPLAGLSLLSFLFYTVGGLGSFVALFFTPQLRTWSRIYLFVVAFGLLAVGHLLSRLTRRRQVLGTAVAALVLVLGVLDQTSPTEAPRYAASRAALAGLRQFNAAIASATQPTCPVFQLPVVPYPEATPRGTMTGYDQQLPYVAGGDLRWSGGAMHGTREADWQLAVDPTDPDDMAKDLAAVGYCAVSVANGAYARAAAPNAPALAATLGAPIAATADGRFTAFKLPAAGADAEKRRRRTLAPVLVSINGYDIRDTGDGLAQTVGPRTSVSVANLGTTTVRGLTVSFGLTSVGGTTRRVTATRDGVPAGSWELSGDQMAQVRLSADVPPGVSSWSFELSGDADLLTTPGVAAAAEAHDLVASAADGSVRVVTSMESVRW